MGDINEKEGQEVTDEVISVVQKLGYEVLEVDGAPLDVKRKRRRRDSSHVYSIKIKSY